MTTPKPTIIYTLTDEAPLLATHAFLPIIRTFTAPAGLQVDTADISVASRVLAEFPEYLSEAQRVPNTLAELGRLTLLPDTNIIKLPNISASVGQLQVCIRELQGKGYAIPDYPDDPKIGRRKISPRALLQVHRQRREPGAARGQFRPPRPPRRQGIRPQEPAFHE